MSISLKSGSLNLLGPSGPFQACNGIAFYPLINVVFYFRPSAKLRLSIHECIPRVVENRINKFPHNVKCSKSILEYAGIVWVTRKAWSVLCSEVCEKHFGRYNSQTLLLRGGSQTVQL